MILSNYRDFVRFSDEKMVKVNLYESHRLFADLYCLEPGQAQRVHSHADNDKIYFVLEGSCTGIIGDEWHRLKTGETAVAAAGVPHGLMNESGERAVLLVVMAPHPSPPDLS